MNINLNRSTNPMTDEMMALEGLLEKTSDADLLREMLGFAAARALWPELLRRRPRRRRCCPPRVLDVGRETGAAFGETSAEQLALRNGDRDRIWETQAGTIALRIPKLYKRSYFCKFPAATASGREGSYGGDPSIAGGN